MISPLKHLLIYSLGMIIFSFSGQFLQAQQTNAVGLPVIQENYGLENPPDLPDLPSSSPSNLNAAPSIVQAPDQPPASLPGTTGSGSVLSTLDNLPPVGSSSTPNNSAGRSFTPQLPEPVRNQQNSGSQSITGHTNQLRGQPRVVRFGDVRNESEARRQYPELASARPNAGTNDDRSAPRLPETKPPTGLAKYNPLRLLNRFNPMRLDKPEPPLVQKSAVDGDDLVIDENQTGALSPGALSRVATADRTDSEIQKRVDKIIREEFGNKTSDFNVEVINREVYIKARPNWFWQRRQLSDELQKLPGIDSKRLHITVY